MDTYCDRCGEKIDLSTTIPLDHTSRFKQPDHYYSELDSYLCTDCDGVWYLTKIKFMEEITET